MHVNRIPKVELHCHLEACFRAETVMEIGRDLGLDVPQDLGTFNSEWLLSRPLESLDVALARFVDIQKIWCSEEVIERMTFEACQYAVEQNIRVMEFRYAPDFIAADKPHLGHENIHAAILRGVERGRHPALAVGLIGIVQKPLPLDQAARTIAFIAENHDTFVGIDFADKDTHELSAYGPMIEQARANGVRVTSHAGEEPGPDAPIQVADAINVLGAERIGHGIHILGNDGVVDLVREKNVTLEVCPTSNWLTSSVPSTAQHPIGELDQLGVAVTVNSDDPALFGIDLNHEYELMHREHGYSEQDLARLNEQALRASFLDPTDVQRAWNHQA